MTKNIDNTDKYATLFMAYCALTGYTFTTEEHRLHCYIHKYLVNNKHKIFDETCLFLDSTAPDDHLEEDISIYPEGLINGALNMILTKEGRLTFIVSFDPSARDNLLGYIDEKYVARLLLKNIKLSNKNIHRLVKLAKNMLEKNKETMINRNYWEVQVYG